MTENQSEESVPSQNPENEESKFSRQDSEERDLEAGDGSILPPSNPEDEESDSFWCVIITILVVVLLGGAIFKMRKRNVPTGTSNSQNRALDGQAGNNITPTPEETNTESDTLVQKMKNMSTKKKGLLAGAGLAAVTAVGLGAYAYMNKTQESTTTGGKLLTSLGFDGSNPDNTTMLYAGGAAAAALTAVGGAALYKKYTKSESKSKSVKSQSEPGLWRRFTNILPNCFPGSTKSEAGKKGKKASSESVRLAELAARQPALDNQNRAATELPHGWTQHAKGGRTYYKNSVTGKMYWDRIPRLANTQDRNEHVDDHQNSSEAQDDLADDLREEILTITDISKSTKKKFARHGYDYETRDVVYHAGRRWYNGQFRFYDKDSKGTIRADYCVIHTVQYMFRDKHIRVYLKTELPQAKTENRNTTLGISTVRDRVMKINSLSDMTKDESDLLKALWKQEACNHEVYNGKLHYVTKLSGLHHLECDTEAGFTAIGQVISKGRRVNRKKQKVEYQINDGQLVVTEDGTKRDPPISLNCANWSDSDRQFMNGLWAKDSDHWTNGTTKFPLSVLKKLEEQGKINLIRTYRKKKKEAFVQTKADKAQVFDHTKYTGVMIRKDHNNKNTWGTDYVGHEIQYDASCKRWRIDYPASDKSKDASFTYNFRIDRFKFKFDYKSTENGGKGCPVIKIAPTTFHTDKRYIRLCNPDTGAWLKPECKTMQFVKFLLKNEEIAGYFKKYGDQTKNEKLQTMYRELCTKLGFKFNKDAPIDPAHKLNDGFYVNDNINRFPNMMMRKGAKTSKRFARYEKRTMEYDEATQRWRIDHPTWFRTCGKYTNSFEIPEFKFTFDWTNSEQDGKRNPVIKISPSGWWTTQVRRIQLCDPKTGKWLPNAPADGCSGDTNHVMRFVKFLLSTGLKPTIDTDEITKDDGRVIGTNEQTITKLNMMYDDLKVHLGLK